MDDLQNTLPDVFDDGLGRNHFKESLALVPKNAQQVLRRLPLGLANQLLDEPHRGQSQLSRRRELSATATNISTTTPAYLSSAKRLLVSDVVGELVDFLSVSLLVRSHDDAEFV